MEQVLNSPKTSHRLARALNSWHVEQAMSSPRNVLEQVFESILFNSRIIVIFAVIGSLVSSLVMFLHGVTVIIGSVSQFLHDPMGHGEHGDELSIALISSVDAFLFATVLLIFAMGIYELFISRIDPASRHSDSRPNWLEIHSLDDLKGALGKVILMILIVRLFETAVKMQYTEPLHLLWLALCVLFVSVALSLRTAGHELEKPHGHAPPHKADLPPAH
jgi:uncharacterized membrane protein YqhA